MPEDLTETQLEMFGHFMGISWRMPLVAVAEIIGSLLFMIPKWRALGALVMLSITTGMLLHHLVLDTAMPGLAIGIIIFAINLWMIFDNWSKYHPIWS